MLALHIRPVAAVILGHEVENLLGTSTHADGVHPLGIVSEQQRELVETTVVQQLRVAADQVPDRIGIRHAFPRLLLECRLLRRLPTRLPARSNDAELCRAAVALSTSEL